METPAVSIAVMSQWTRASRLYQRLRRGVRPRPRSAHHSGRSSHTSSRPGGGGDGDGSGERQRGVRQGKPSRVRGASGETVGLLAEERQESGMARLSIITPDSTRAGPRTHDMCACACVRVSSLLLGCVFVRVRAYACICVHMRAYACICVHMRAYACSRLLIISSAARSRVRCSSPAMGRPRERGRLVYWSHPPHPIRRAVREAGRHVYCLLHVPVSRGLGGHPHLPLAGAWC